MHSVESLGKQVIQGNEARRHFERTPLEYAQQILQEAEELVLEITQALITGDPYPVAGEIGDLYILLAQLCDDLGISPTEAMSYKIHRNQYKYPDHNMNNGYSREEAVRMSKETYVFLGGDAAFNQAYLEYIVEE